MSNNRESLEGTITEFINKQELTPAQRQELTLLLVKDLKFHLDKTTADLKVLQEAYKETKRGVYYVAGTLAVIFNGAVWVIGKVI